ncbi:hypothetical protein HM1_2719 [Heliomicrobium modesticaldum Ice1]|uniref:Uncharacterized protein n=1 Tax=Heliobacterium modesticaldum (strain ATCC 51547 / Ice1) TaxID=498761 RepID=B0TBX5_HELMI|nr:hypothetical protein [Heliomicrobium modesticaldum]ABZ85248.1 hypothetical protein HM1_2719 [Heliomicrobium modesticaldum Ice1]
MSILVLLALFIGVVIWLELGQKKTYRKTQRLDPQAVRRLIGQGQSRERFPPLQEYGTRYPAE